MARQVSWTQRLREISRTVENSVRSHYTGPDLEQLFKVQPRTARYLLSTISTDRIGRNRMVSRDQLARFLAGAMEAEDVSEFIHERRAQREADSRKRPRHLVRRDLDPVQLASLPIWIRIREGHLEMDFQTTEQLAEGMLMLARILEGDGEEFARRFEPCRPAPDPSAEEVQDMFRELVRMEVAHGR